MKNMSKFVLLTALAASMASHAFADDAQQENHAMSSELSRTASSQPAAPMSEGEVRKIDKDGGKLTIKHGPLANLDMPGMTMVFRVKDPAILEQVRAGDKITFVADKVGGQIIVTQLQVKQ